MSGPFPTARRRGTGRPDPVEVVRGATLGLLIGLMVQFLAGMLVNLFVKIPDHHPGSNPPEYFGGSVQSVAWAIFQSGIPALIFHAVWGLVLVLGGLRLIFQSRRLESRRVTIAAILGFLFVLGAGFNGASFLDFNLDGSSMIMATLFALATVTYVGILYVLAGTV